MSSILSLRFYSILFVVTIQLYNCQQPIHVIPFNLRNPEESSLCLSNHQNRFLFAHSTPSNGCSIMCSFLASSSTKYSNYYDAIETVSQNLPEKTLCETDSYCLSNVCTHQDDFHGKARLLLADGYFPGQDSWTQTDTYVKVYSESKLSGFKYIGRARVIHNNDNPSFLQTFTTELSSKEGHFILGIFDYESDTSDHLIVRTKIMFEDCPKRSWCSKDIGKLHMRYSVRWIPQI